MRPNDAEYKAIELYHELRKKFDDVPSPEGYTYGTKDTAWLQALEDFQKEMEQEYKDQAWFNSGSLADDDY